MYSQVKLSLNKDGDCGLMFWRGFVKPQAFLALLGIHQKLILRSDILEVCTVREVKTSFSGGRPRCKIAPGFHDTRYNDC